jgi:glycosyltransferase involved in cell wall biosynthesis
MHCKVSVLMTTYNHERFIAQAVSSVLEQRVNFHFELVVGEDCSTDRTRDILCDFQARYPETIRLLLREENWGRRKNFIDTFKSCQGDYIAILEGDDYWISHQKLQKQADFLDSHPECSICFHPVMKRNQDGDESLEFHGPSPSQAIYTIEDLLERTLIVTCSVMFRNHLFDDFPTWFHSVPAGDWPLNILNAQHGNIGYIDEAMAVYRMHSGGVWSSKTTMHRLQGKLEILKTLRQHLDPKHKHKLDHSIAQTHLRIIAALARDRDPKGIYVHLSHMIVAEHVSATSLASAGLKALHRRMRKHG